MIGYLAGLIKALDDNTVLVDVAGVGYLLNVVRRIDQPLTVGQKIEFYVHTHLRENALELFGFTDSWEKKIFELLTTVSGIGPKTAVGILSHLPADILLTAITREDKNALTQVSGIGKKTAERLILELAEKARKLSLERPRKATNPTNPATILGQNVASVTKEVPKQGASFYEDYSFADSSLLSEAVQALTSLGYRDVDALNVVHSIANQMRDQNQTVEVTVLVKQSLQQLAKGLR